MTANNNPGTFDEIALQRPALAAGCLAMVDAQPGRPLAMFAPRRVGKTWFLDHDLAPAARAAGKLPVYADLWLQKAAPLEAINHALAEALDDALVPAGRAGKSARTQVKGIGLLGVQLQLADEPARRALPDDPALRLDALVTRLHAATGKPVLLMLDEVQTLADGAQAEARIAALRAVLHQRRSLLQAVFTGSSQEDMARLLSTVGAPMYQFAQLMDFPVLGDDYLRQLADHFHRVHPAKQLALDALQRVFARIGHKPALMRDLVKWASAEGVTDLDAVVQHYLRDARQMAGFDALLQPLDGLERALLLALAQGRAPMGRDTLQWLGRVQATPPTLAKVRAAIERLRRAGLVARGSSRGTTIDDPLLADHLLALAQPAEAPGRGPPPALR